MKAHLAKLSLALLSTVFLLGCQERGSGPVGPEGPQFNPRPHDHSVATYTATWESGPITGDPITLAEGKGQRFLAGGSGFNTGLNFIQAGGSLAAFLQGVTGGSICFAAKTFTGAFQILLKNSDPQDADMLFSFPALSNDGTGLEVNYALEMFGVAGSDLPPATMTDITWTTFDIHPESGPGRKVACSGTGSLTSVLRVTKNT